MTVRWTMTVDCAQPAVLAAFWRTALGYVDAPPPTGFASWPDWFRAFDVPEDEWDDGATIVDPEHEGATMTFLKVPEPKVAKNRLHLDLHVSGGRSRPPEERRVAITAVVERLVAAGGSVHSEHALVGVLDHVVLLDPEGNELCVV